MLTTITAIAGLIFGLISLALSFRNYWLDRPKIIVNLEWDVMDANGGLYGYISITNAGRRPVFIISAGLEVHCEHSLLPSTSDLHSKNSVSHRLNEGDPSLIIKVPQKENDFLLGHRDFWRDVYAFAVDSGRKLYFAKAVSSCPTWGKGKESRSRKYNQMGSVQRLLLPSAEIQ